MLTVGSLFSGVGGIDLGLERAGFQIAFQVEIDDYCNRVLAKHWPDVPRFRDVRIVGAHNLPRVDVLAGGFPCQPHSEAGRRKAGADDRDMWPEYLRLIRELRPRWVLGENVRGLLSSDDRRYFGAILRDLAHSGYDAEWSVVSACALGAPHTRERVFILAYPAEEHGDGWGECQGGGESRERCQTSIGQSHSAPASRLCETAGWWTPEPGMGRAFDGLSSGMDRGLNAWMPGWEGGVSRAAYRVPAWSDRLGSIGNAVVPQVAEYVGRLILSLTHQPGGEHV